MNTKYKYGTKELSLKIGNLSFGKMIESHRLSEGYSQREFAKQLGISPASLFDLEKGRKLPSIKRAVSVALTLGLSTPTCIELAIQDQLNELGLKYKVSVA